MMNTCSLRRKKLLSFSTCLVCSYCIIAAPRLTEALVSFNYVNDNSIVSPTINITSLNDLLEPLTVRYLNEDSYDHDHEHDNDRDKEHHEEGKPWIKVMIASLVVNVAAIVGIVFLIPSLSKTARNFCQSAFWEANKIFRKGQGNLESCCENAPVTEPEDEIHGNSKAVDIAIPSFACGALIATTVFLVIPESLHRLELSSNIISSENGHDPHRNRYLESDDDIDRHDESDSAWKFGLAVLSGFIMPLLIGLLFPRSTEHECNDECGEALPSDRDGNCEITGNEKSRDEEKGDTVTSKEDCVNSCCNGTEDVHKSSGDSQNLNVSIAEDVHVVNEAPHNHICGANKMRSSINYKLCLSVLIGDAFHNFCDGIFIGVAFSFCKDSVAYSIMSITLYHEIAQELADFFLLTKHGGLPPKKALLLNFLSGLSVALGGIVILASNVTQVAVGVILGIAAGVYIHIAACECLPRVEEVAETSRDRLLSLSMFVFGTIPIGLVLLKHDHCVG